MVNVSVIWKHHIIDRKITGGRIVGGEVAMPGQFRFAAAIYIVTADSTYFCAGSLIMLQWILTAGQCVDG
jgi:secreted trypsin-like serine protease